MATVGRTTTVRCALAPFASPPMVHVTVPETLLQPALAETKLTPVGSVSVIVTPAAASGPLLATVSV